MRDCRTSSLNTSVLPRNLEGLLKGTKKSVEDIGGASARFCVGFNAVFQEHEAHHAHENQRKDIYTQALVYVVP
jgi:hypothetical protein